jgi:ATP-dependent Lon protease
MKSGLEIRPVATMEEVLKIALVRQPVAIVWEEPEDPPTARIAENQDAPVVTH